MQWCHRLTRCDTAWLYLIKELKIADSSLNKSPQVAHTAGFDNTFPGNITSESQAPAALAPGGYEQPQFRWHYYNSLNALQQSVSPATVPFDFTHAQLTTQSQRRPDIVSSLEKQLRAPPLRSPTRRKQPLRQPQILTGQA